ncbi:MAG: TetR family transcriptional regulator [Firmicutes bacterium]|nr:TetR family transcriptional regulator [Bacillota bacterium]
MTAQKIQQVALKLFAEKGYDATALSEIATKTGIKKPSIYAHFPGKMELFLAIVKNISHDYQACWTDALEQSVNLPADKQLELIFFAVGNHYINSRDKLSFLVRLWLFPPADCATEALDSLHRHNEVILNKVTVIFQQGIKDKIFAPQSPSDMAQAYFCMLDGYLARVIRYPNFDYKRAISLIWQSFMFNPPICNNN